MKTILQHINKFKSIILTALVAIFYFYGQHAAKEAVGAPATTWMNVYSYKDFGTKEKVKEYLRDLRTGIPPVLSYLEITSYNRSESIEWITKGLYQKGLILAFLLPLFLTQRKWWEAIYSLGLGMVFLLAALEIHPGNPQLYDVLMPAFLLAYLIFSRISFGERKYKAIPIIAAVLAGFFLSMAELSRPFLLLLIPFLLFYSFYHYQKTTRWRFLYFIIPFLIFSGGWHAKLMIYNNGQVIWSNHGGTNLANAWAPILDFSEMDSQLAPEAPPVNDYGWARTNLNTQVHADNSKIRQQFVFKSIFQKPGDAIGLFFKKLMIFTAPQTGMYSFNPEGKLMVLYRVLVKILFIILGVLILWAIYTGVRNLRFFTEERFIFILLASFLTFIPTIGENGEESRFLISVLPFLMLAGMVGIDIINRLRRGAINRAST